MSSSQQLTLVPVAVGVVINSSQQILIAERSVHPKTGILWEFPGGKIEANETPYQALCRELNEEVGIQVTAANPLLDFQYDYRTHHVHLHVWHVTAYQGEAHGREAQLIDWVSIDKLQQLRFPAANHRIVEALRVIP